MKKLTQHPITYEHIGFLIAGIVVLIVLGSAFLYWTTDKGLIENSVGVKSVVCYFSDGSGPATTCPAMIKCYNGARGNLSRSEIPCPMWPRY